MYKFLLCWRYLRTRYIALASIISVTLGVATMIVVNSVMAGFTHEMQDRIHGILSDVVVETRSINGLPNSEYYMKMLREVAGEEILGVTPTATVPAMFSFKLGTQDITKQVMIIGIDPATYSQVSDFGKYLQHPENRKQVSFRLREKGYDTLDHQADDPTRLKERIRMAHAGWGHRRQISKYLSERVQLNQAQKDAAAANPFGGSTTSSLAGPGLEGKPQGEIFDPAKEQHIGCIAGIAIGKYLAASGAERFLIIPGDDIDITLPSAGKVLKPLGAKFTIVDFYESKMSEYDTGFVFVPIDSLQNLRGLDVSNFNAIQIKVKPGVNLKKFRDKIRKHFSPQIFAVSTWKDKQGLLLDAVRMETTVLNILLFMIIAVAGFGILAIFYMIVVEKTRDIGILKALGASSGGVMNIFLGYGLSLGIVGSGVGMIVGLLFVKYINEIADGIGILTGQEVFDPSIYYFSTIPTLVSYSTVFCIVLGALIIAVVASILPARRAARFNPVEALRYE